MLLREEIRHWARVFGVADEQIRRDHLISHILVALAALDCDGLVFYGGTALARTHLPTFRLSEDVDLLVTPRGEWARRVEEHLPRALRRGFGAVSWRPAPTEVPAAAPVFLVVGRLTVRIQLQELDAEQAPWPLERRELELRYGDAGTAEMWVPTRSAFAAMKTLAWADRHAPRDLADLAQLASTGGFDLNTARLVYDMSGTWPRPHLFSSLPGPTRDSWATDLAHQMLVLPGPDDCLQIAAEAWAAALAEAPPPP